MFLFLDKFSILQNLLAKLAILFEGTLLFFNSDTFFTYTVEQLFEILFQIRKNMFSKTFFSTSVFITCNNLLSTLPPAPHSTHLFIRHFPSASQIIKLYSDGLRRIIICHLTSPHWIAFLLKVEKNYCSLLVSTTLTRSLFTVRGERQHCWHRI